MPFGQHISVTTLALRQHFLILKNCYETGLTKYPIIMICNSCLLIEVTYFWIKFVSYIRHVIVGGFPPGTPISSTNKTDRHDITETLLKMALNAITLITQKWRNVVNTPAPTSLDNYIKNYNDNWHIVITITLPPPYLAVNHLCFVTCLFLSPVSHMHRYKHDKNKTRYNNFILMLHFSVKCQETYKYLWYTK